MKTRTRRRLARYWGYLLFLGVAFGWLAGGLQPIVLIPVSALVLLYFLFQAPVWCGAENRDGTLCRNNSSGLVLGCRLSHHKWQRLKALRPGPRWLQANRALWAGVRECLTSLATIATVFSGVIAGIQFFTA